VCGIARARRFLKDDDDDDGPSSLSLPVIPSETNSWIPGRDEVEEFLAVFAHEGLHVMTRHVVPLDAIIVEIVQNG